VYEDADAGQSIEHLKRAAELSPHNPRYRYQLALACESAGDKQCADSSWELVSKLCPTVPLYHWHAGQSYLRTNHVDESLVQFRLLLGLDPKYGPQVWFALRNLLEPDVIFQKTLAQNAESQTKVAYIDFLSDQGDFDAAYRTWRSVAPKLDAVPFSVAKPYLEQLIANQRTSEAQSVWLDLQKLGIVRVPAEDHAKLVFNGDFEQTPLNAGFDWRQTDQMTYLAVDFAAPGAYHGTRCLRVDFTVKRNEQYEPAYEVVPVLPNRTYNVEAYVRSEAITSDSGPYLRVSDPQRLSFEDVMSETTIGTTAWHPVRMSFSTGPETETVKLSVWRPRGRTFPMEISGSFWVDAVSLNDMGPAKSAALESSTSNPTN
jgi:tetratricopeptide (TPR) repeat protein